MLAQLVLTVVPAAPVKQAAKETMVPLVQQVPKVIPAPWVVPVLMEVPAKEDQQEVMARLVTVVFVPNIALLTVVFSWMEVKENFDL